MDDRRDDRSTAPSVTIFLVEWLLLAALMAASLMVLGAKTGRVAVLGIALVYVLCHFGLAFAAERKRPKESRPELRTEIYAHLYWVSGAIAGMIVLFAVILTWMVAAYVPFTAGDVIGFGGKVMVPLILLMAVCYQGSLVLLRRRGVISGSLPGFLRADVVGLLRSPHVTSFAMPMVLCGLLLILKDLPTLETLVTSMHGNREASFLDIVGIFPFVLLGLLATPALLAAFRAHLRSNDDLLTETRRHLEGAARPPVWPGMVTAVASLAVMIGMVYEIHVTVVARASFVPGVAPWEATSSAIEDWIAARRDEGLGGAKIAATLSEHGRWMPDAPEAGLAAIMPDLGTKLSGYGDACGITVAAGPTEPSAVAGSDWMSAEAANLDIRYCIRIACPSPVTWRAPPSLLLHSSHPSRNRYWLRSNYFDIFAAGVAAEPGGYCTADGALAEDFMG